MHIPDCSKGAMEAGRGGFADVLQGAYQGRRVAIKIVRVCLMDDLDVILSVSLRPASSHRVDERVAGILPRGSYVETPPTFECPTAAWSDNK
jgi:hypothetical protein